MVSLGRWIPNVNHNRSGSLVSNGIAYRACHSSDTANTNCRCLRPCMYHLYALGCVVHENEYDAALCQSCNVEPPLDQVYYSLSRSLLSYSLTNSPCSMFMTLRILATAMEHESHHSVDLQLCNFPHTHTQTWSCHVVCFSMYESGPLNIDTRPGVNVFLSLSLPLLLSLFILSVWEPVCVCLLQSNGNWRINIKKIGIVVTLYKSMAWLVKREHFFSNSISV